MNKKSVPLVPLVPLPRGIYPPKTDILTTIFEKKSQILIENERENCNFPNLVGFKDKVNGTHTLPETGTTGTTGTKLGDYFIIPAYPATGILYIINNFLSGHVRLRGRGNGAYPYKYLEMIDAVFGKAHNTIEVCSGHVPNEIDTWTVDTNFNYNVDKVDDAQVLSNVPSNKFDRWRCDPPYNKETARKMYGSDLPDLGKLLKAGARVIKPSSLMFLLCSQNYQMCPSNVKRIGLIYISVVPNNETRVLNVYVKLDEQEKEISE